jgi:hypothetical protein
MASITISRPDVFPASTSVAAYPATVYGVPSSGAPYGSSVETESVAGNGTLTFDSLAAGTSYVLYGTVGGQSRYLRVNTSVDTSGTGDVDTSQVPGFVKFNGTSWPARPDFEVVFWIGGDASANDPSASMSTGDVWYPESE